MQVFVPYPSPIDVAKCLDRRRLRKQIIECDQILAAIGGKSEAWKNHPVVKMYEDYSSWLYSYRMCLSAFSRSQIDEAMVYNVDALEDTPFFLTGPFCDQHKRRLFTKSPELYPQFAGCGKSDENWYFVDGQIVKYVNSKKI